MKNQVIKNLSEDMGKEIIQYFRGLGIDTRVLDGSSTYPVSIHCYYGVIDGRFENYSLSQVRSSNAEIIELPVDKFKEFREAFERGETVQFLNKRTNFWCDKKVNEYFYNTEYRVKPREEKWNPKRGDKVLVRDSDKSEWVERIYLATIEGAFRPYVTVDRINEDKFTKKEMFETSFWKQMKQLPEKVELTKQQIADKFGIELESLEIKD